MPCHPHKRPLIERLFDKVSYEDDCWIYTGHVDRYSRIRTGGEHSRRVPRHVAAYELFVGPVPEGMELDHLCRRTECFNPAHVEPVTGLENILRSDAWGGVNSRKAHCPQRHPYDSANTRVRGGRRHCRACEADRHHHKRKGSAA